MGVGAPDRPLGLIFVVNTIAALVEKFFTQQTGAMYGVDNIAMIMKMGGVYEVVMTVAKSLPWAPVFSTAG